MFRLISEKLSAGEDLVLVTVIASSGATPRGAGARMLVGKEGRLCGTIGGGAVSVFFGYLPAYDEAMLRTSAPSSTASTSRRTTCRSWA